VSKWGSMIDATHGAVDRVPAGAARVALYATGSSDIVSTLADRARFHHPVLIDQSDSTTAILGVRIKDIESGASTIPVAIAWARNGQAQGWRSTFYISAGQLAAARAAVHAAGLTGFVDYWVANWNLSMLEAAALLGGDVVAIQYASPSSNPTTLMPGSRLTLRQANVDLSVVLDSWYPIAPKPAKPPRVHPKVRAAALAGALYTALQAVVHGKGLHITPVEASAAATAAAVIAGYLVPSKGKR
jgi:hypothetical protein